MLYEEYRPNLARNKLALLFELTFNNG